MAKLQEKKHFKIVYALLLNAVIMAFFLIVIPLHYEMPDDYVFSNLITDGSYNFNFMSPVMASLMGLLQRVFYPVNAYVVVCLLTAFFACTAITRVFIDKFNPFVAFCFTIVLNGFLGINHYGTIAYTRMAALMTVAGFLCIVHYSKREKWKLGSIIGIVLILFGSIFRFAIFEVSVAAAGFFVIGKSITDYYCKNKEDCKPVDFFKILFEPKRFVLAIVAVVLCFAVSYGASFVIRSDSSVDYFIKYTAARSNVYDYMLPEYEENKEAYERINVDDNDLFMLRHLYMDDEGAFTYDQLKEIRKVKDTVNSNESSMLENLKLMVICEVGNIRAVWKNGTVDIRNFGIMAGNKGILYFFVGTLLLLFLLSMKKRNYFIPLMLSIITLALYIYLWRDLKVPFRAVYPLWISFAVYLMYSFSGSEVRDYIRNSPAENHSKTVVVFALIASILFSGAGVYLSTLYNQYIDYYKELDDSQIVLRGYIADNKDKKFELSKSCSYGPLADSIWVTQKTDYNKNYIGFAGTYYRLPKNDYETERFGTDNMFTNLFNDDVFFIVKSDDSHADMMKKYLQKYYSNGKTVEYTIVDTVDKYQICKYELR